MEAFLGRSSYCLEREPPRSAVRSAKLITRRYARKRSQGPRKSKERSGPPAVSGEDPDRLHAAKRAGATVLLSKPVHAEALDKALAEAGLSSA
jgi:hypothetical protein